MYQQQQPGHVKGIELEKKRGKEPAGALQHADTAFVWRWFASFKYLTTENCLVRKHLFLYLTRSKIMWII